LVFLLSEWSIHNPASFALAISPEIAAAICLFLIDRLGLHFASLPDQAIECNAGALGSLFLQLSHASEHLSIPQQARAVHLGRAIGFALGVSGSICLRAVAAVSNIGLHEGLVPLLASRGINILLRDADENPARDSKWRQTEPDHYNLQHQQAKSTAMLSRMR
jgi:hypothetical protein